MNLIRFWFAISICNANKNFLFKFISAVKKVTRKPKITRYCDL